MRLPAFLKKYSKYDYIDDAIVFVKISAMAFVFHLGINHLWDAFEISYDDYEQYSTYLDHDFCGEVALDYAADGRVTVFESTKVKNCIRQDEKRAFYSKLEAK
ncbi:hypothetical protein L7E39_000700 [Vibrio parahaemolyticus]|nr:hypothetical protein [Vibrio parahaemolyticus]